MIKLNKENPKCFKRSHEGGFQRNNKYAGNRKGKRKAPETINKHGFCDLQIADKVLKLKEKLGKTPTLIDLSKEYGGQIMWHIHKRYKGYIALCHQLEIVPNFSNYNPKYSREYFIEKGLSNEANLRILTISESRHLYKHFKGGVKEWKQEIEKYKNQVVPLEVKA